MQTKQLTGSFPLLAKVSDYAQLTKFRLSFLVVISALTGYFFAVGFTGASLWDMFCLIVGGFLVSGASNGFNQVIERDFDKVMKRTANRPLPSERMGVAEALFMLSVFAVSGIALLWFGLNPLSGLLGFLALFSYVAIYTPAKRVGPVAVFIGAFPGAIPPLLGYVAATGEFGLVPGLLFVTQFIWQFPHFWAIAWKAHDDYAKAGYRLLPSASGKSRASAFYILVYTLFLVPISLFPLLLANPNEVAMVLVALTGAGFVWYAIKLFNKQDEKSATQLMFASFLYLPVVQLLYLL